jgi:hypothetical protein
MIAFAARAEDSTRYLFAGAVLLLLTAASSVRSRRPAPLQLAGLTVLVALALPANLAKMNDGQEYLEKNAALTRGEFAMLELAGDRGDPGYLPVEDPQALAIGASVYLVMPTAIYLDAAERIGSLADPLDRVRAESVELRRVDDWTLTAALGLMAEPVSSGAGRSDCDTLGGPGAGTVLTGTGALIQATGSEPLELSVSRFAPEDSGRPIGSVEPGDSARVLLPEADAAPEPWRLAGVGSGTACSLALR